MQKRFKELTEREIIWRCDSERKKKMGEFTGNLRTAACGKAIPGGGERISPLVYAERDAEEEEAGATGHRLFEEVSGTEFLGEQIPPSTPRDVSRDFTGARRCGMVRPLRAGGMAARGTREGVLEDEEAVSF